MSEVVLGADLDLNDNEIRNVRIDTSDTDSHYLDIGTGATLPGT